MVYLFHRPGIVLFSTKWDNTCYKKITLDRFSKQRASIRLLKIPTLEKRGDFVIRQYFRSIRITGGRIFMSCMFDIRVLRYFIIQCEYVSDIQIVNIVSSIGLSKSD